MNIITDKKFRFSIELTYAAFAAALLSLFLLANYFSGFNLWLYLIVMAVAVTISVAYPRAGLCVIIFLTFIFERFFTLVPIVLGKSEYKLYPIDVFLAAVIVGTLFQLASGKLKMKLKRPDFLLLAFAASSIVYFFVSAYVLKNEFSLAFSTAKNYAFYSLFYFVSFVLIDSEKRFKELAVCVFAGAVGICWFILYGFVVRHGLWSDFTPLSTEGIRTLAFTHAYYVSLAIIIALVYMAYRADIFSRYLLIITPLWALGIVGSMMRHLWISVFVAIAFIIVVLARNQRAHLRSYAAKYAMIGMFLMVILVYGATLFPRSSTYETLASTAGMIGNRVTSIANTTEDESIVWRSAVWKKAMEQFSQSPLFGIGYGEKVSVEIGKYHDFVEVRNIHNSFLVILVQMGIVGLSILVYLIYVLGKNVYKRKEKSEFLQIASLSAIGILLFQVVAFMFQPYLEANLLGIFFWINLGLLRRLSEENQTI